jgi:peptidoglycan/LPS O-acetylase OafA/YrhL
MNYLQLLTKYRTELMGFAIIWFFLYHFGSFINIYIINEFCGIGYGGVDIFIFLSGFGLFFSMSKTSISQFYKKRFWRIFPAYFVVVALSFLLQQKFDITKFLITISTLGFWIPWRGNIYYEWYIPSIVLLYLLFPYYYKRLCSNAGLTSIIFMIIGLLLTFCLVFIQKGTQILFFYNVPRFSDSELRQKSFNFAI